MNKVTRTLLGMALGLAAIPTGLSAAAQPPGMPHDGLPPGVERLCAGPIVSDPPSGVVTAASTAADELPPLPPWCDGTCVIDIAFLYAPEAIGGTSPEHESPDESFGPQRPQSAGELRRDIEAAVNLNNVAWRRAGLDAKLRVAGIKREPRLNGLPSLEALGVVQAALPEIRGRYGADLVYAITAEKDPEVCGRAHLPSRGVPHDLAAQSYAVGAIWFRCLRGGRFGERNTLAHEVGHNLGLVHPPADVGGITPFVPFGHGYRGQTRLGMFHTTIMGVSGGSYGFFSTPEPLRGRVVGSAGVSDAARALRYTIPGAARYSPTVVPEKPEDPRGYGCRPSSAQACLNERQFRVPAN